MAKKRKRYRYQIVKKRYTVGGKQSTIFAGISVFLLLVALLGSLLQGGEGGMYLGAIGVAAIGISVYGFFTGLKSFSEKNRDFFYSKLGAIGNGILMICWLTLFLIGL